MVKFLVRFKSVKYDWLLLALAAAAYAISTLVWISKNQAPPCWDPADHVRFALDYYRPLAAFDLPAFARAFFLDTHYYAPAYHLLVAAVFPVTGAGLMGAGVANLLLLAALMAALYMLGRALYARAAGLLAAIIAPAYHINAALMHEFFLDFALMCWSGVTLWLLYRAREFASRRDSLLLGAGLGLGLLCKQPFLFFFALPVAYTTISALYRRRGAAAPNIALALAAAAAIAALWYLPHLEDVRRIYEINRAAAANENDPPLFTYFSNLHYVHELGSGQMQFPFFALFLIGLVVSLCYYRRESMPLYLTIVGGLAIFTCIANKDIRYTMPLLPAVALISTSWLGRLSRPALIAALSVPVVAWAAFTFLLAQWPWPGQDRYFRMLDYHWAVYARNYLNYDARPAADDWGYRGMLAAISARGRSGDSSVVVGFVPNLVYLNPSSFALHAELWNERARQPRLSTVWLVEEANIPLLDRCRYIITRGRVEGGRDSLEQRLTERIRSEPERFVKIGELPLTTLKDRVVIYEQLMLIGEKQ